MLLLNELSQGSLAYWVVSAAYKITSKLKATWKYKFIKIQNTRDIKKNNKETGWFRMERIFNMRKFLT